MPDPQRLVIAGHDVGILVDLEADAVTRAMDEAVAESRVGDDRPRSGVDRLAGGARPDRRTRFGLGTLEDRVAGQEVGSGRSVSPVTQRVRVVSEQ